MTKSTFEEVFNNCNKYIDEVSAAVSSLSQKIDFQDINYAEQYLNIESKNEEFSSFEIIYSTNVIVSNDAICLGDSSLAGRKAQISQITIETNGFIGNTKECYIEDGSLKYTGELNPMIYINGLINESFCMIELLNVPKETVEKIGSSNFEYDNGVSYISYDNALVANINIDFSEDSYVNSIRFNDKFQSPFYINVKTIDLNGNIQTTGQTISKGFNFFNIERNRLRKCVISVIQDVGVGKNIAYSDSLKLSDIGIHIKDSKLMHPSLSTDSTSYNLDDVFKNPLGHTYAYSKSVCIGSMSFSDITYEPEGSIIKKFTNKDIIKSISLYAQENKTKDHSIEYFISHDNENYERITPVNNTTGKDVNKLIFSHSLSATTANSKTVLIPYDLNTFYLKIVLKTDNRNTTPVIEYVDISIN